VRESERLRSVHLLAGSGGSFGGSSMQQEIGLGNARRIEEIVIRWPGSGTLQKFSQVPMNRVYLAKEDEAEFVRQKLPGIRLASAARK
jgi:hypothetical protein